MIQHFPFGPLPVLQRGQNARPVGVRREGDGIVIETHARSYLHHQVRSMLGSRALVGMDRWTESQIGQVLAAVDRQELGLNA